MEVDIHKMQREWLMGLIAETGLTQSKLASGAGVDHSTLSKFLNDKTGKATLHPRTVEKLRATYMVEAYTLSSKEVGKFSEAEARVFDVSDAPPTHVQHKAIVDQQEGTEQWVLNSRALEYLGYLPGDILIIDPKRKAERGDIVCARVFSSRSAETVFRLYEHPWLIAATGERNLQKPVLVDNDNARILGVVVSMVRHRVGNRP